MQTRTGTLDQRLHPAARPRSVSGALALPVLPLRLPRTFEFSLPSCASAALRQRDCDRRLQSSHCPGRAHAWHRPCYPSRRGQRPYLQACRHTWCASARGCRPPAAPDPRRVDRRDPPAGACGRRPPGAARAAGAATSAPTVVRRRRASGRG